MEQPIQLTLQLSNKNNQILAEISSPNEARLLLNHPFEQGDKIVLLAPKKSQYVMTFDENINSSLVYLNENKLEYPIPFDVEKQAYPPKAFTSKNPILEVKIATQREVARYRNLSVNSLDRRGETTYFPHCTASVETRGESVFAARNTIDGITENTCHGEWPYQSWGDDEDPTAEIMIDFGRPVKADKVVVFLRADFPHDNYWKDATFSFSDGSELAVSLQKTKEGQTISFESKIITWVKLGHLVKDEKDPSPFPALSQWEVYGTDII